MGDQGHVRGESWPTLSEAAARSGYTRQARRLRVRAAQAVKNLPRLAFWRSSPVPVNVAKFAYLERRGSVGAGAALAAAAKADPAGSLEPEAQPVWRTDVEPW